MVKLNKEFPPFLNNVLSKWVHAYFLKIPSVLYLLQFHIALSHTNSAHSKFQLEERTLFHRLLLTQY